MTDDQKMDFWSALARLYDETLVLRDQTVELRKVAEAHQRVVARHQMVAEAREKRLNRLDVLVGWLAEKERAREQRAE